MNSTVTTVARVNNVDIQLINNGEKRIAIKPICEALSIDYSTQVKRIKDDPILGSVVGIIPTTGADKKTYEMLTIPFEFVFGWLFLIDSRKVGVVAQAMVVKYQKECYHALYSYFTRLEAFLRHREKLMTESFEKQEEARFNFSQAKNVLDDAKEQFRSAMHYSEADWMKENQMALDFDASTTLSVTDGKEESHE